jgi:hypothetical protein
MQAFMLFKKERDRQGLRKLEFPPGPLPPSVPIGYRLQGRFQGLALGLLRTSRNGIELEDSNMRQKDGAAPPGAAEAAAAAAARSEGGGEAAAAAAPAGPQPVVALHHQSSQPKPALRAVSVVVGACSVPGRLNEGTRGLHGYRLSRPRPCKRHSRCSSTVVS